MASLSLALARSGAQSVLRVAAAQSGMSLVTAFSRKLSTLGRTEHTLTSSTTVSTSATDTMKITSHSVEAKTDSVVGKFDAVDGSIKPVEERRHRLDVKVDIDITTPDPMKPSTVVLRNLSVTLDLLTQGGNYSTENQFSWLLKELQGSTSHVSPGVKCATYYSSLQQGQHLFNQLLNKVSSSPTKLLELGNGVKSDSAHVLDTTHLQVELVEGSNDLIYKRVRGRGHSAMIDAIGHGPTNGIMNMVAVRTKHQVPMGRIASKLRKEIGQPGLLSVGAFAGQQQTFHFLAFHKGSGWVLWEVLFVPQKSFSATAVHKGPFFIATGRVLSNQGLSLALQHVKGTALGLLSHIVAKAN